MNWHRHLLLPLAALAFTGRAAAQLAYTQTAPTVQANGGFTIAADALNPGPGYDREAVGATLSATIHRIGVIPTPVTHRFSAQLIDALDRPVPLDDGAGQPVPGAAVTTIAVTTPAPAFFINVSRTVSLRPLRGVNATGLYRVRSRFETEVAPGVFTVQIVTDSATFSLGIFGQTVSEDSGYHVLARPAAAAVVPHRTRIFPVEARQYFTGRATLRFDRYDAFDAPYSSMDLSARITYTLFNDSAGGVQVESGDHDFAVALASHSGGTPTAPATHTVGEDFAFGAAVGLGMSPQDLYRLELVYSYEDEDGSRVIFGSETLPGLHLLVLNGSLLAGPLTCPFDEAEFDGATVAPDGDDWTLKLTIPADHAHLPGGAGAGFAVDRTVRYHPDSGAVGVLAGFPLPVAGATGQAHVHGVRVHTSGGTLSDTGLTAAEVRVWFPAGFSVMVPPALIPGETTLKLEKTASGRAILENVPLDGDLLPSGDIPLTPLSVRRGAVPNANSAAPLFFCHHERLPCWFAANALVWSPIAGTFTPTAADASPWLPVRAAEQTAFNAIVQQPPATQTVPADHRPANDSYFLAALGSGGAPHFLVVAAENGIARLTATCPLAQGTANPHFPQGTGDEGAPGIAFMSGAIVFADNELVTASSRLENVFNIKQRHARDPMGTAPCANRAGEGSFSIDPTDSTVAVTEDGGLLAAGNLIVPAPLSWGTVDQAGPGGSHRFAHATVEPFTAGTFYQPGNFYAGTLPSTTNDDRAGTLLLTGRGGAGDPDLVERPVPGDEGYFVTGAANYPGLNLRVADVAGGMDGVSALAGQPFGPYPLSVASRYSVHRGGVCGVHQREFSPVPEPLNLYGFASTLIFFKLGWLDGHNETSVCDGGLAFAYPSGFSLAFENLRFNERGQPGPMHLPGAQPERTLAYWGQQPFTPLGVSFQPEEGTDPCAAPSAGAGFVEMAVRFPSLPGGPNALIPGPIYGTLGFKNGGDLITLRDRRTGLAQGSTVDSRLILPPSLRVSAPGGGDYALRPVSRGYFSAYPGGLAVDSPNGAGTAGTLNFAGRLEVPFFESLPVHVQVQPNLGQSGVFVLGGWTENGDRTFFNDGDRFDEFHRGTPPGLSVENYRQPATPAAATRHLAHARKNWLGVVDFDYPLEWNASLRRFESTAPVTQDLLLFRTQHQCGYLTATGAEIKFGADIQALPELTPQKLLLGALDGLPGNPIGAFDRALDAALRRGVDATGVPKAAAALDQLLSDRLRDVMEPVAALPAGVPLTTLRQRLHAAVDALSPPLPTAGLTPREFKDRLLNNLGPDAFPIGDAFLAGLGPNGLVAVVQARIDQALSGLDLAIELVSIDVPAEGRGAFRRLVNALAADNPPLYAALLEVAAGATENFLEAELSRLEKTPLLAEIEATLRSVRAQLAALKTQFAQLVGAPLQPLLQPLAATLRADLAQELDRLLPDGGPLLQPGDIAAIDRVQDRLTTVIDDAFYASEAAQRLIGLLRQTFNGQRGIFRQALDELLAQVSTTIKEAAIKSGTDLLGPLPGAEQLRGAGQLASSFAGTSLRGYARTVGHSISTVRLDGSIRLAPPGLDDGIEGAGYVEYRDHELLGPNPDCLAAAANRATKIAVLAGAHFGSTSRPKQSGTEKRKSNFDGMSVSFDVDFAFDASGLPIGFAGNSRFIGEANFGLVTVNEMELTANFSSENQFVIGKARGKVLQLLSVEAELFAGNTRCFDRLGLLDPYTGRALDQLDYPAGTRARMAGTVFKALGGVSLNDILPIPRDVAEIQLQRGYTYLALLAPDVAGNPDFGDPSFMIGLSEYGKASVKLFRRISVGDVEVSYGGVVKIPEIAPPSLGNLLRSKLAVNGGARACGPCLDLGIEKLCLPCVGIVVKGEVRPLPSPPFALFYLTGLDID